MDAFLVKPTWYFSKILFTTILINTFNNLGQIFIINYMKNFFNKKTKNVKNLESKNIFKSPINKVNLVEKENLNKFILIKKN